MESLTSPSSSNSPATEHFPRSPLASVQIPPERSEPRYGIYAVFLYKEHFDDMNVSCVMGCYDPSTNIWSHECLIPGMGKNQILKGFSMVSVGTSIYIIGGSVYEKRKVNGESVKLMDHGVGVQSQVLRYDVITKEWFTCEPLNTPRYDFACSVCDNKIYVAGGLSTLEGVMGMASAEVYDVVLNKWTHLPLMSTVRYKCVGVTYQGKFHVIGGFTYSGNQLPFMDRCSAEVYDMEKGRWDHVSGMWKLDIPPNQIVVIDDRLISSGDCLNVWKGQIETYDHDLHLWLPLEGSKKTNLSLFTCPSSNGNGTEGRNSESLRRICLTMAPVGKFLYFLAGYRISGDNSSCCTMSVVHRFDTTATNNNWETFEAMQVEGERELCSHCCVVRLP